MQQTDILQTSIPDAPQRSARFQPQATPSSNETRSLSSLSSTRFSTQTYTLGEIAEPAHICSRYTNNLTGTKDRAGQSPFEQQPQYKTARKGASTFLQSRVVQLRGALSTSALSRRRLFKSQTRSAVLTDWYTEYPTYRDLLFDLKTAQRRHKALDLAGRRGFVGFQVALNAQSGEVGQHHFRNC